MLRATFLSDSVDLVIRNFRTADLEQVRQLLTNEGWAARVSDPDRFDAMLAGATRVMVATKGDQIVAFGRAITDGASNGYLSMVVVHRDFRRRGLGRQIVEALMGTNPDVTWVLRVGEERAGARAFWESLGFQASSAAMERLRRS